MRRMRVLLLDNYDSFTFNLYQQIAGLGADVDVVRNDEVTVGEVIDGSPGAIVISPGPSVPERAGIAVELVRAAGSSVPMLGVCLGHQAIGVAYGGQVIRVQPVHGKRWPVEHRGQGSFTGLPSPFDAARYHSLAVARDSLSPDLQVTAWSGDGTVMGMLHRSHPVEGIQFHPESILTEHGDRLMRSFLDRARDWNEAHADQDPAAVA